MKPKIHYVLLAALLVAIIYPSVYLPGVVHETRDLTLQMNTQIDSLRQLLYRYDQTLIKYDTAYHQLVNTRERLSLIEQYYKQQHAAQQAELHQIVSQLNELSHHPIGGQPLVVHSIDSLLLRP